MTLARTTATVALAASLCANAGFAWKFLADRQTASRSLAAPDQLHVIRTKGGLLQVSSLQATETFQATTDHKIFAIFSLGSTTTQIRVPAVYHYHIELAPEWQVTLRNKTFLVIAPRVQPTLPVAIDTARLESFSAGAWSFFTGPSEREKLQKSITQALALRASQPAYIDFQRESARETVREFVAKWLFAQPRWNAGTGYAIKVFFSDEPIDSLHSLALPPHGAAP
ncbi:MAG: hypothetical protein JWP79_1193 [Polaromonas sp.]|nr:hypothetical protein [Polaromonas sp.]